MFFHNFVYYHQKVVGKEKRSGQFLFKGLYRNQQLESPCAILVLLSDEGGNLYQGKFWCIPGTGSDNTLYSDAQSRISEELKLDEAIIFQYATALAKFTSQLTTAPKP
ncbi:MAG: hypothetical protein HC821_03875 [Lewinella sp.]|nr:hypothetical protein [Lewinella sp.]